MTVNPQIRARASRRIDSGYVLLTLVLMMATMAIFAAVIVPSITFEIKRDREEEMIHRGVQYSRAIRAYYKKTGRYPTKIEDLENTNNQRFLRKRYKDPLSCKNGKCADFKLLHFGEVQMALGGIPGGTIPGANPAATPGGLNGGATGGLDQNQQPTGAPPGSDPSQPGAQASPNGTGDGTGTTPPATGSISSGSNQLGSGQIIGGPIIGVASVSKDPTIREFNHKKKYKDWVFVYDPAQDQGRLITTPYQPQLQGFGQQGTPNLNGQNGSSGQPGSGFGSSNGFGNSSGMGNNPTSPNSGGFGQPNPPTNPPPQQQQ
jgi:type II secretory pathway pseudopilin PulG